jgi:replicative DNA helicase
MSNPSAQKTSDSGADSESRKDSLPPHDEDAEAGALACVITGSEMMLGQLVRDHFYDLRHKEIYDALCQLRTDRTPITVVSLDILLRDQGRMLKAGGQDYISRLPDRTPNASFFPSYLDSLRNYSTRRTILRDTTELQRLAKDTAITIANVADAARRIAECYRNCGKVNGFTIRRPNEILGMAFDDNDIILGDRLLAIAQVLVIAAAGGIGKSRLACQLVACIISGKEFLGFRTGRPGSRILILQTENSNRRLNQDLARLKAWLGDDWPRFDDQVRIHTIETKTPLYL